MSDINEINHPTHYGGANNPYEAIKVMEACNCGGHLFNALKYLSRAGKKEGQSLKKDLNKALWYLKRMLEKGIKNGFVRQSDNPFKPLDVAKAWGLSKDLTNALHNIWNGNIQFAILDIEKQLSIETSKLTD
jgi:hypothetical protein